MGMLSRQAKSRCLLSSPMWNYCGCPRIVGVRSLPIPCVVRDVIGAVCCFHFVLLCTVLMYHRCQWVIEWQVHCCGFCDHAPHKLQCLVGIPHSTHQICMRVVGILWCHWRPLITMSTAWMHSHWSATVNANFKACDLGIVRCCSRDIVTVWCC